MTELNKEIAPGSTVTLHVAISLLDGTEALSTFNEAPMDVCMGDGALPEGLELALYGLREGDEQTLQLSPAQAFGRRDEALVHSMSRDEFPAEIEPEVGQVIHFTTPSGDETAGTVIELSDAEVVVDFNHPLAGQGLVFKTEILSVG